jgi:hypothetical protein
VEYDIGQKRTLPLRFTPQSYEKPAYMEATKRVLIELKVIATQAYRRLIEEIDLPIPNYQPTYTTNGPPGKKGQDSECWKYATRLTGG